MLHSGPWMEATRWRGPHEGWVVPNRRLVDVLPAQGESDFRILPHRDDLRNVAELASNKDLVLAGAIEGLIVRFMLRGGGHHSATFIYVDSDGGNTATKTLSWLAASYGEAAVNGLGHGARDFWMSFAKGRPPVVGNRSVRRGRVLRSPATTFLMSFSGPHAEGRLFRTNHSTSRRSDRISIFSGGSANRDYPTLVEAVRGLDYSTLIVTDDHVRPDIGRESSSGGGTVRTAGPLPIRRFVEAMAAADIVAIPLTDDPGSCGQLTLALAMRLGKAIVCTNHPSLRGYVRAGREAILVRGGDPSDLRAAIQRMASEEPLRIRLGRRARFRERQLYVRAKRRWRAFMRTLQTT